MTCFTRIMPRALGIGVRLGIALIRCYQTVISPVLPRTCRYHPSCSEYALRAVTHRGLLRGSALALWRLLRCNPFSQGGYDPGPWAVDDRAPESGGEAS